MKAITIGILSLLHLLLVAGVGAQEPPELVIQMGQSFVDTVKFSPDGNIIASSSSLTNAVKLWDLATRRELRVFDPGPYMCSQDLAFSPDGKTLACGGLGNERGRGVIILWSVLTGEMTRVLKGHDHYINKIAFSADGNTIASAGQDGLVKLWDARSGNELFSVTGHTSGATAVAFSQDGKTVISAGTDGVIKLWDLKSLGLLASLKGHTGEISAIALSPDGTLLASGGSDRIVRVWDLQTRQEKVSLTGPLSAIMALTFSNDGTVIVAGCEDKLVKVWDFASQREIRTLDVGKYSAFFSLSFHPKLPLLMCGAGAISLRDISSWEQVGEVGVEASYMTSLAFTGDGKNLISAGDGVVRRWGKARQEHSVVLPSAPSSPKIATTSRKDLLAIGGGDDNSIRLIDLGTGGEVSRLVGHQADVSFLLFNPFDERVLASGSADKTIKIWDVSSGKVLHTLDGYNGMTQALTFVSGAVVLVGRVFAPDDERLVIFNINNGRWIEDVPPLKIGAMVSIALAFDGRAMARAKRDLVEVIDMKKQEIVAAIPSAIPKRVVFSPNGRFVAIQETIYGGAKLIDLTKRRTSLLGGNGVEFTGDVSFSPDNKILAVTGKLDNVVELWDTETMQELARLVGVDEKNWLVVTPSGLFDGSPESFSSASWRFDNNTFSHAPIEAFFSEFYYPGLLSEILAGRRPVAPQNVAQKDRRQPKVEISLANGSNTDAITTRTIKVKLVINEMPADSKNRRGSGAQDLRLFRNGSLVRVWRGDVLKGQESATLETSISVIAGHNELTAYVFNHDNVKSNDASLTINGSDSLKRPATVYVVAVGVNRYSNAEYNLRFAVADAQEFAAEIKRQQDSLRIYAKTEILLLSNERATKTNFLDALKDLTRKVQPEDVVIVFFSGHGTARDKQFYLIP